MNEDSPNQLDEQRAEAVRQLVATTGEVRRLSGREPLRDLIRWLTCGRWGVRHGWPVVPVLDTPWQDSVSAERPGWRTRAANLDGEFAFAVDYQICITCRLGWVEQPYTLPQYQRCGVASAGLAALRAEHPGFPGTPSAATFAARSRSGLLVGADVLGRYEQRDTCEHVKPG